MSAKLEALYDHRLRSLDLAKIEHLPYGKRLASRLTQLKSTVFLIRSRLPYALRSSEERSKSEKLITEVTNLASKLEQILNELDSTALHRPGRSTLAAKVRGSFNRSFLSSFRLHYRLGEITTKFHKIVESASRFEPLVHSDDDPSRGEVATVTFGRVEDVEIIVKHLIGETRDGEPISVLPIVGVAGIGKTTLARLVFEDPRVGYFNVKSWVPLNEDFDVSQVVKELIKASSIPVVSSDVNGLPGFPMELLDHLSKNRFLLVLDNVRGNLEAWDTFSSALSRGAPGSKIMVTTRNDDVASLVGTLPAYNLKGMNDQDCWSLLARVAFPDRTPDEYSHLESIGKKMVQKCQGQPLAAKVFGGILRDKLNESEWNDMLKSGLWDSGNDMSVWDPLISSYEGLQASLKLCFAYCSIFPKDYKILKDTLIQLWLAEELVLEQGSTTLETTAEQYIVELLSTSFFKKSNEEEGILMPTLISYLAQLVSGQTCYHLKDNSDIDNSDIAGHHDFLKNVLYLTCVYDDVSTNFEALSKFKNLRTLLITCSPASGRVIYSNEVLPHDVFTNLAELRTLCLSGLPMQELPDSIGNLKQLRFLDLSHTLIEKLPNSTSNLSNLLTLRLDDCIYLSELPGMENLINLRHLHISGSNNVKTMPSGMSRLTNLQSLSNFIVREISGPQIRELKDLVHLRGKLSISGLENVSNSADAKEANLTGKIHLDELVLEWNNNFGEPRNEITETGVLESLKPFSNLKVLHVICYGGTKFPEWVSLLVNLVRVSLNNCRKCSNLPLLGQLPSLEDLSIEGMDTVISIGVEFFGEDSSRKLFPSLRTLEFKDMPAWEQWSFDAGHFDGFHCLQKLTIQKCPKLEKFKFSCVSLKFRQCSKLKELAYSFPSLVKLKIWECQDLTSLSKIPLAGARSEESTSSTDKEFPLLSELDIQSCAKLRKLPSEFPSLHKLSIRKCKELVALSIFPKLSDLILEECDELMLGNEVEVKSLSSMVICQLPKFAYPRAQLLGCLSQLINLEIFNCDNLVALSENDELGVQALNSLERLVIDGCPKLKQLPDLFSCFRSLKELIILGCQGVEFYPETKLPPMLKRLVIEQCSYLKSLPRNIFNSQDIALEYLEIYGCPRLVSFSEGELPTTLKVLSIWDCFNLEFLPVGINQKNTSLNFLRIWNCHSLKCLSDEVGLPCNLLSLSVMNCENLKPLSDWGLKELANLRNFSFGGCANLVDFNAVELPDSLSFLLLKGIPTLESLSLAEEISICSGNNPGLDAYLTKEGWNSVGVWAVIRNFEGTVFAACSKNVTGGFSPEDAEVISLREGTAAC
ncbi:putative disease resistance RPP13-like protein 1 [Forsythia ovata]|uniref:Disease resistance RPP13-like protein 1 n=1 Tax=Forsythia ovata TaxID=205694 RepID=A0ABD1VHH6_9LAMI